MILRRPPTLRQKQDILAAQDHRCNLHDCRRPLVSGLYQWDHIQDRQFDGDNALDNWQAICTKPCHANKTKRASKARAHADRLASGGRQRKSRPMAGGKSSAFKRGVDGRVTRR
jgi:5-methylcytosine-specific restriction endonuclease McrA